MHVSGRKTAPQTGVMVVITRRLCRDTSSGQCGTLSLATDNDLDEAPSDGLKTQQALTLEVILTLVYDCDCAIVAALSKIKR